MAWVAPVIAGATSIIGDLMGQSGQEQTNQMNWNMMMQNEKWQEGMSNTAMQRRVADYKAAGLNPVLAAGGPGASQPSVSQPQMQNPNAGFNNLGGQITSALALEQQQAQIQNIQAQTRKTDTETDIVLPQQVQNMQADFALTTAQASNAKEMLNKIVADETNENASTSLTAQQITRMALDTQTARAVYGAVISATQSDAAARRYGLQTLPPEALQKISNVLQSILAPVGSAVGVAKGVKSMQPPPESMDRSTTIGPGGTSQTTTYRNMQQ